MAARDVRDLPQPARRLRNHSRRALHQRFKHKRGVGISSFLLRGKFLFNLADTFPVALAVFARVGAFRLGAVERTAVAIRRHDLVRLEQQPGVAPVKQINVAERDRADGVAVIRAFEGKKFWLAASSRTLSAAPRAPGEFVGELERDFQRRRAVVARKKPSPIYDLRFRIYAPVWLPNRKSQIVNRKFIGGFDQFFGQQRRRFIRQAQRRSCGRFFQLPLDGRVDFRMLMAVQVGPDGRIGVEIFAATHIAQHRAFAFDNHNRLAPQPVAHLRERMPDETVIKLSEPVHRFLIYDLRFTICSSAAAS